MRDNLGFGADAEWARARARDAAEKPAAKPLFGPVPEWVAKPAAKAAALSTPVQKPVQGPAVPFAASSSGVHAALKQQGWKTPPPAKAVRSPEDVFKLNETKDLASFSYVVEPEEWSRITKSFEGRPGYTSPTAQAAQVNPFKPVEGPGIMPDAPRRTW